MNKTKYTIGDFKIGDKVEVLPPDSELHMPPKWHAGDQLTIIDIRHEMLYFKEIFGGWYPERVKPLIEKPEYKYCVVTCDCSYLPLAKAIQKAKEMTKVDNFSRVVIEQGKVAGIAELVSIVEYTTKQ